MDLRVIMFETNDSTHSSNQTEGRFGSVVGWLFSRLLALVSIIPLCVLSAPFILYVDVKWGSKNDAARKAQQRAIEQNALLRAYMWAHRILLCQGVASRQRW